MKKQFTTTSDPVLAFLQERKQLDTKITKASDDSSAARWRMDPKVRMYDLTHESCRDKSLASLYRKEAARTGYAKLSKQHSTLVDLYFDLARKALTTPATTIEGLLAQQRLLIEFAEDGGNDIDDKYSAAANKALRSGLLRLVAEGQSNVAKLRRAA